MKAFLTVALLCVGFAAGSDAQASDSVVAEGIVDAPVAAVWRAWTTSEGLQGWLAPHADIELRVGGLMRANYDTQGTLSGSEAIENRILSFDPERMLSIQVSKAPSQFPFKLRVSSMWTVLYFQPTADGKTLLKIVGLGFAEDEESQRMKAFFERGNAFTLTKLQRRFRQ